MLSDATEGPEAKLALCYPTIVGRMLEAYVQQELDYLNQRSRDQRK